MVAQKLFCKPWLEDDNCTYRFAKDDATIDDNSVDDYPAASDPMRSKPLGDYSTDPYPSG